MSTAATSKSLPAASDVEAADRDGAPRSAGRSRACRFCADTKIKIDYKDVGLLRYFITDRGKVVPRRLSGCCAQHQREVAVAIRRARMIALVPFTTTGT